MAVAVNDTTPTPLDALRRVDAAYGRLLATGPKWFKSVVWDSALLYVRRSNAWPRPYDPDGDDA